MLLKKIAKLYHDQKLGIQKHVCPPTSDSGGAATPLRSVAQAPVVLSVLWLLQPPSPSLQSLTVWSLLQRSHDLKGVETLLKTFIKPCRVKYTYITGNKMTCTILQSKYTFTVGYPLTWLMATLKMTHWQTASVRFQNVRKPRETCSLEMLPIIGYQKHHHYLNCVRTK